MHCMHQFVNSSISIVLVVLFWMGVCAVNRLGHQPGSDLYESEWEAYYFEDAPPESIVFLLDENCKDATQKDLDQY